MFGIYLGFVSFLVEVEPDEPLPKTGLSIGVDVGLKSFITLSNGEQVDNPRFFVHEENALAKAQRKLSNAEKGTPERARALKVVHRVHERITNKRDDFVGSSLFHVGKLNLSFPVLR